MTSWQEKSLLVCFGLVFQPILWFWFCFHSIGPHICTLLYEFQHFIDEAIPVLSDFFVFHFGLPCWFDCFFETYKVEKTWLILCCNGYGHAGYYCFFEVNFRACEGF